MAHIAWGIDPMLALRMTERFIGNEKLDSEVSKLIRKYPEKVRDTPEAVPFVVDGRLDASSAALRVRELTPSL